ncbi:hypothetical protein K1719_041107 [Acacia pycnantha]|nr:hypothetical protein K1719_041107 [Acacia pycnantha]
MTPKVHVAIYKVCNASVGCLKSAILAAMDITIDDGVDVLSLSLGGSRSVPFYDDPIALGSPPDWSSPAAIKSAIMTTASTVNLAGMPILDERLLPANVFTTGYTDEQINMIVDKKVRCSEIKSIPEAQLNYPSFSIIMGSTSQYYTRTVTNVGPANSTYYLQLDEVPLALGMSVNS